MADVDRIKRNIGKMIDQGAPESDIDAYVASEGTTPEALRAPQGFMGHAMDAIKSIPRGLAIGATSAQNPSFVPMDDVNLQMDPIRQGAAKTLIDQTYEPQGPAGKITQAAAEGLANPISYLGPGGLPLKVGGAILSGAGGEAGALGAEALGGGAGTQTVSRLAGALGGGAAAVKTLGTRTPKAATPTLPELEAASVSGGRHGGYEGARASGLELDPKGVASWAADTGQKLYSKAFSGGTDGTAPRTFAVLEGLQKPPSTTVAIGPVNLDAIKAKLQDIAQEVRPTSGGAMVASKDAAAASKALEHFREYVEGGMRGHVVAGDAGKYIAATKEAAANNAAFQRGRDFDARITKAERAAEGGIATSLENQIKAKARQVMGGGAGRGLSPEEFKQLELINSGGPVSNTLGQLGRGGAGVVPLGAQATLALATGGAHLVPQAALASLLYGARKTSEKITKSRASKLAEILAQRSPLYQDRLANLPAADTSPGTAALIRAMLAH